MPDHPHSTLREVQGPQIPPHSASTDHPFTAVSSDTDAGALPLISLQAAGVCFGPTQALHDISLSLHRGERLALVGSNGSGKTTLLRLMHGVIAPQDPAQRSTAPLQPEGRPAVGAMVFQHPFFLRLSARRNLLLALWLRGVPRHQRGGRVNQALQRVGMAHLAERPAQALSGGQQQRLALARAWALQPDILFLDEPTASLDPSAKREVEALIAEFARDGVTLVMSTHNLGQAKRLATRVAHLEAGRLTTVLPVDRFFDDPHLPEATRQFLKGELPWLV
jgi:tungstate transport system ATP-binding protein